VVQWLVVVVVVVVVVVDGLFSWSVANSLLLTFCHDVHINILFKIYSGHTLHYIVPEHVSVLIHLIQMVRMTLCPIGLFVSNVVTVLAEISPCNSTWLYDSSICNNKVVCLLKVEHNLICTVIHYITSEHCEMQTVLLKINFLWDVMLCQLINTSNL
jgi:hypothetical protein